MLKFFKEFSIQEIKTGADSSITDSIIFDTQYIDGLDIKLSDEVISSLVSQ